MKCYESTLLDVITFTSTSETKMHHFCQFSKAAGGQNGDFQTFLDFEKTRAFWDLLRADVCKYRPEVGKIKFLKNPPKIMYTPLGILVMKI